MSCQSYAYLAYKLSEDGGEKTEEDLRNPQCQTCSRQAMRKLGPEPRILGRDAMYMHRYHWTTNSMQVSCHLRRSCRTIYRQAKPHYFILPKPTFGNSLMGLFSAPGERPEA